MIASAVYGIGVIVTEYINRYEFLTFELQICLANERLGAYKYGICFMEE